MLSSRTPLLPRTIAMRLYLACALVGLAALSIAGASLHYTHGTRRAVQDFQSKALRGVQNAADLSMLLDRHRRIIERAPVVVPREQLERGRRLSERIIELIDSLVAKVPAASRAAVQEELPVFVARARRVLDLAASSARRGAVEEAMSYRLSTSRIERAITAYRNASVEAAEHDVALVAASGKRLTTWVLVATLAIAMVLLPAVWLLASTVRRLRSIARSMLNLARNDIGPVPRLAPDADEVGDMARAVSVFRAHAMQLMEQRSALEELNRRFDIALGNMSHGLSMFDGNGRLVVSNGRYREIYGLPPQLALPGTPLADILAYYCALGAVGEDAVAACPDAAVQEIKSRIGVSGFTETRRLHDGRIIEVTYRPIDGGGWVDVHEDITEKKTAEERISRLAREDTLTGVANRHAFQETLNKKLVEENARVGFALHWIDLDRFKEVNDVHGHPVGDALLAVVAQRITATVRASDFVARLGGDEFAVIQCDVRSCAEAEPVARRLIEVLSVPFDILGTSLSIGASIGIAVCRSDCPRDPELLLHNADIALYEAKAAGRGKHVVFRPEIEIELRERRSLEADLRKALELEEFELHYQPIVDLVSGEVKCCEALLRWHHPVRGTVSPGVFIPIAEELGLIADIGGWVLETAIRAATGWPPHVGVAVNLSASQFAAGDLPDLAERALARWGLPPGRLELEVTETLLLEDQPATHVALLRLRSKGVGIALDDFGTGYASLSYLRSFPFDKIKIDQTFVRELPERPECLAIVTAICEMARMLGIRTVAEGVETPEHVEWVRRAGCSELQGFLFSRPVPAAELPRVLEGLAEKVRRAA